ncbi:lipid IV(A) 3-deoxy-D-manno-octulosonic acid transferase [Vibrio sp. TRT 17S01]|uniref:lipid IV(A) 3-deoxy-D-manno-octulosonic acid transferase n=1 Tax=Vibrio sp. TRT 17S01 TaxID=3418505 RepID=UPI003CEF5F3A
MSTIVRYCYTFLLMLISPILLWGLYRSKPNKPRFGSRWKEHFGFTPELGDIKEGVIWVHAVSVGEVLASKPLVLQLRERYPTKIILITTTTSTGAEQASKLGDGVIHRYMPIDFSWCVRRFLNVVQPEVLLIIETEIWPNTIHTVTKSEVPIVLVNGRLSEKSANNYQKLRLLIVPALQQLTTLLTVHDDDKQRFLKLGASETSVTTTGSLKYDISVNNRVFESGKTLRNFLGLKRKVWIAASTHLGEDEQILQAYKMAKQSIPELLLVLVPRHPERFDSVAELIENQNLSVARRTLIQYDDLAETIDVYLGDTMGEMMVLLAASDLVFMGGSLIGQKVGGHNFIEPAVLSKACITGPSYYNFADLGEQLINAGALEVVEDSVQLSEKVLERFSSPNSLKLSGEAGCDIVLRNQGALKRTLAAIDSVIESSQ